MGDDESRREEARVDALIEKGLRNGSLSECPYCGDIRDSKEMGEIYEDTGEVACLKCSDKRIEWEEEDGQRRGGNDQLRG